MQDLPLGLYRFINIIFYIFCFNVSYSQATAVTDTLSLTGNYLNTNIYIQNPLCHSGFCVKKVIVNSIEINFEQASAFEINLKSLQLNEGDAVKINIIHSINCKPKLINNNPAPTKDIGFYGLSVKSDTIFEFKTKRETYKYTYVIEQFKWNKWVEIGKVPATGIYDSSSYSVKIIPHSGENKIRIKIAMSNKTFFSSTYTFLAATKEITFVKNYESIIFSANTFFEVYDKRGNIIYKGIATKIDLKKYKKGIYFLNYDNKSADFIIN